MSAINYNDATFGSIYIKDGLVLDHYYREMPGTIRFNKDNNTFEGYTGQLGPLGETWRELTLDIASKDKLGGIKIGNNLFINSQGELSSVATGHTRFYENVITVSNIPPDEGSTFLNGDFQSLTAAISYINDLIMEGSPRAPSETTPLKIIVSPGIYDEQIMLQDYVSLQGEGSGVTIIRGLTGTTDFDSSPLITLGNNSTLENITIQHNQGGANNSTGIYIYYKNNINIKDVEINMGNGIAGIDVSAITINHSNNININNITINITEGTRYAFGITLNYSPLVKINNTNININAASESSNGIYALNNSDIEIYNTNILVNTGNRNIALKNINSAPTVNYSKLIATSDTGLISYGIFNDSSNFITSLTSNEISLQNNAPNRDTITLPDATSFKDYHYIKINNSSYESSNNTFFVNEVSATQLFLEPNVLINELAGNNITINQYYTVKLNYCHIQGTTTPLININPYYAIKENNTIFSGQAGLILNNGLFFGNDYKTLIVSHENGDFNTLSQALESISDNSEFNRYIIMIKPGTYRETSTITTKPYVNIVGSGKESTILSFNISNTDLLSLSSAITITINTIISDLTIQNNYSDDILSSNYRVAVYSNTAYTENNNFTLLNVKIIINDLSNTTENIGIYTDTSFGKIYNTDILINGQGKNTALHGKYSLLNIVHSTFKVDSSENQNLGLVFESSNGYVNDSQITIDNGNNNLNQNYGLLTINPHIDQYLVQILSTEIIVNNGLGSPDDNYSIFTADNQTIVGVACNLVGKITYNNTPGSNSILKLQACWSVQNIDGNILYYSISEGGVPISSENGNLIIGQNAGNLGMNNAFNNTIVGNNSGSSMTTADNSTLLGFESGNSITDGNNNTFLGQKAGKLTTNGDNNTFTGNQSGQNNDSGSDNSAYGAVSLFSNVYGNRNVAVGKSAGYNINNDDNILIGNNAGYSATTSKQNVIIGNEAGLTFTSGDNNVMIGFKSGNQSGSVNNVVSIGYQSGYANTSDNNIFMGANAGYNTNTAQNQTIIGYNAGYSSNGDNNTILGSQSANSLTSGTANITIGVKSGYSMTTGSRNILFGSSTTSSSNDSVGYSLTSGSDNIMIGSQTGSSMINGNQSVLIGNQAGNSLVSSVGTIAIGYQAGSSQQQQSGDIFIGHNAGKNNNNIAGNLLAIGIDAGSDSNVSGSMLFGREAGKNLSGSYNIALGYQSMKNQTVGAGLAVGNVLIGHHSGLNITSGSRSVGIGGGNPTGSRGVLSSITSQTDNTAIGYLSGQQVQSSANTLVGSLSGSSINLGSDNTMIGFNSGSSTTLGSNNVSLGSNSFISNSSGNNNTSIGTKSGYNNITGNNQVVVGNEAGYNNTGSGIVAIGNKAGRSNTSANNNIFIGNESGLGSSSILTGESNIMVGYQSGYNTSSGQQNILIGEQSGYSLTTASKNVMIGDKSGYSLTTGNQNVFIGSEQVGYNSTIATDNVFIGYNSGYENKTGNRNLFFGSQAAINSVSGSDNICMGNLAGFSSINASYNIYIGSNSGFRNNGIGNIAIGYNSASTQSSTNTVTFDNVICIGNQSGLNNKVSNLIAIGSNSSSNNEDGLGNISIGFNANSSNISGNNNIAIGNNAGQNSLSNSNIFIGSNSGLNNTDGNQNMYIGTGAGENNISGSNNMFIGYNAGNKTTTSNFNIAIGYESSYQNIDAEGVLSIGYRSGRNNIANNNVFIGNEAGLLTTTGTQNLFLGNQSGKFTTTGTGNLYLGYNSGYSNTLGNQNMFIGYNAGYYNTQGSNSLFFGAEAGYNNTTGNNNLAIGFRSQKLNTAGQQNTSIGNYALYGNNLGNNNLVFGTNAASSGNIGDNNVILGSESSKIIKNPSFANNIVAGYASNKQGFASKKSIIMGSNSVSIGAGGENNIIIGQNTATNLGLGKDYITPTTPSNGGENIIYIDNTNYQFIKTGQYLVISYNDNKIYDPQIVYTTSVTETSIIISDPLTTDISVVNQDKLYLLYGDKSSVIENGNLGDNYIIVKTPISELEQIFTIGDKVILQLVETADSQTVIISNITQYDINSSKITINQDLQTIYSIGDVIYLARLNDDNIGILDTSFASSNIVLGYNASAELTSGSKNVAIGDNTLFNVTTQKYNTAIGTNAGYNVKSENNLLFGTKTGYSIDKGITGKGGNTIIGFAAGQFAGSSTIIPSENNLYIGNRVAQINQGSNNIFIGQESETVFAADSVGKSEYSNKLAIYNSDSGVPSNPLIGGDLNNNLIGLGTIEPKSTLEVAGSFATKINKYIQFESNIEYLPGLTQYWDKTETSVTIKDTQLNNDTFALFKNKGNVLIGSEFIAYDSKFSQTGITGLTGLNRGIYNTTINHNPDNSLMFDVGVIKTSDQLSIDLPSTGIISVKSINNFDISGITALVVIDGEIIQFTDKGKGLGGVERGISGSVSNIHLQNTNVYVLESIYTTSILTQNMDETQTYVSVNSDNFLPYGTINIDSEFIDYPDKTPYLFNVIRGTNNTTSTSHLINSPIYLVVNDTDDLNYNYLSEDISNTGVTSIKIDSLDDFVNTGYVIINSEIINYVNIALLNITRATSGSSLPISGFYPNGTIINLIASNTSPLAFTYLDQEIDENGIFDIGGTPVPPNTIILRDGSGFPASNGTILIENELITYGTRNNNTLNNCERGKFQTTATSHQKNKLVYNILTSNFQTGIINRLGNTDTAIRFNSGHNGFPSQGTIVINGEIITYSRIALNELTRGVSYTSSATHITGATVYNFSTLYVDDVTLSNVINNSSTDISLSKVGTMTNSGTILIDSELIKYSDGIGLINVTRAQYDTIAEIHTQNTIVYNVQGVSSGYSQLSKDITEYDSGLPIIDNSIYSEFGGLLLVDSEYMTFTDKHTLDNVTRGAIGSIPSNHLKDTNVNQIIATNAVTSFTNRITDTDNTILLEDITDFNTPGNNKIIIQTLENQQIKSEILTYTSTGNSLATFQNRGIYDSGATSHNTSSLTNVYEVTEIYPLQLGNRIESNDLSIISQDNNTDYTSSGNLLVGYEIIDYQNKNHSIEGTIRGYRSVSGSTSHNSAANVYDIIYNNSLSTPVNSGITGNSKFLTTDTSIPVSIDISNNTNYPLTGSILVGTELINYTSKQNTLVLDSTSNRGLFDSTITSHISGSTASFITISTGTTATIINNDIIGTTNGFIPLDDSNGFGILGGIVKVNQELINYTYKDYTILSSLDGSDSGRGQFNSTATTHNNNTNVYNINLIASTTSLQNISSSETTSIILNDTSNFNDSGNALIYDNTNNTFEIITYGNKNRTLIDVQRGLDQSLGLTYLSGDTFSGIIVRNDNIELSSNISTTSTYLPIKSYDGLNPLISDGGYLALNNELIEYSNNGQDFNNINRNPYGYGSLAHNQGVAVNKLRDYDEDIPLHNLANVNGNNINYPYFIGDSSITRSSNGTISSSHTDQLIYIISDNTNILTTRTLASNITSTQIILTFSGSNTGFSTTGQIIIDSEIMNYELITSTNTLTISRARNNTVATQHIAGKNIYFIPGNLTNPNQVIITLNQNVAIGNNTTTPIYFTLDNPTNNTQLNIPPNGIVLIESELITYTSSFTTIGNFTTTQNLYDNYSLTITRGTNSSSASGHIQTNNKAIHIKKDTSTLNYSTLSSSLGLTATSISVSSLSNFSSDVPGYVLINTEIIKYAGTTTIPGNTLTDCIRGYGYITQGITHNNGSTIYRVEKPYEFYVSSITAGSLTCNIWPSNTPLNIFSYQGTFLIDNEIITYNDVANTFTNKLLNCTRNVNKTGNYYPSSNLLTAGTGITGSYTITSQDYGNGKYYFQASSITANYYPSLAFSNYEISTTLTADLLSGVTSSMNVNSTTNFPSSGKIIIDSEIITYTGKTTNTFTGLDRSSSVTHYSGSTVNNNDYSNVGWRSNNEYSITGLYTGSQSTIVDSVTYNGEWLQIQTPQYIIPSSLYVYESDNNSTSIVLAGSNTGTTWTLLNNTYIPTAGVNNIPIDTTNSYAYFRYIILSKKADASKLYCQVNQMNPYAFVYFDTNIIQISNLSELYNISSNLSGNYLLTNNITTATFTTISGTFTGIFSGDGYTITIGNVTDGGIFKYNNGTISNVNIIMNDSSPAVKTGSIASYNNSNGIIEYCNVTRTTSNVSNYNGGLVSYNYGIIRYCKVTFNISSVVLNASIIGGLIAECGDGTTQSSVYGCSTSGTLRGQDFIGGLIGWLISGSVSQCSTNANIIGLNNCVGGFIGMVCNAVYNLSSGIFSPAYYGITININNCYSSGNVTGQNAIGGVFGCTKLYGETSYINVTNVAYFLGTVTQININTYRVYIFVGFTWEEYSNISNFIYTNCYCDIETSYPLTEKTGLTYTEPYTLPGIYGKTVAQMQTLATYNGWDFTNIWNLITYPLLRVLNPLPTYPAYPYPFSSVINNIIYNKFTQTFQLPSSYNESILIKSHSKTDSVITILDTSGFNSSGYLLINNEFIKYTSITGNNIFGITRGVGYLNSTTHKALSKVLSFTTLPSSELYINESTYNNTTFEFDQGSRSNSDINPGNLCIIGERFNEIITVESVVGYNKNTYDNNNSFALSYLSNGNYLSKEIITANTSITLSPIINGTISTYYLIGNSLEIVNDFDRINNTIVISGYSYTPLSIPTTLTVPSTTINKFNILGGYLVLFDYDSLGYKETILVTYSGISGNDLTGISIVGQNPTYTKTFTYLLYLKWNDSVLSPVGNLLNVGVTGINVNKNLIPLNSVFLGIRNNSIGLDLTIASGNVSYTNVNRYQRYTTPTNSTISKLVRVDSSYSGVLHLNIEHSDTSIPTETDNDFGQKGIGLVENDYFSYYNGFGIKSITRGALNTSATGHITGTSYYQYQLGDNTTLRTNITTSQNNIPINNNSGLTGLSYYLITSTSGNKNYEVISSTSWNKSLDSITRSQYSTINHNYLVSDNIDIYGLDQINVPNKLRSNITSTTPYIPLLNDPTSYFPKNFGTSYGNYILIENELIKLESRNSLDLLTRNFLNTNTSTNISTVTDVAINQYSNLRQNISSNHIFLPLNNASSYDSSGYVLINSEWMYYTNKNTFDFTLGNRGKYNTIISDYESNPDTPVLMVSGITNYNIKLRSSINQTTNTIPLDTINTPYTVNNLVLINAEFIKTGSKYSFDYPSLLYRQRYNTNLFTTGITADYNIYQVSLNAHSVLRDNIGSTTAFMPIIDGSSYSTSGIGLINSEFFSWDNKNSLDDLIRGLDGTSATNHELNTGINIVARIADFNNVGGNIVLNKVNIVGDKVLLSDDISGIKLNETLDLSTIPNSGTVVIGSEEINYNSKDTIADIIRGTNSTQITTHTNGKFIYLIDNTPNTSIDTNINVNDIELSTITIQLTNPILPPITAPGYIIIDSEIIKFDVINSQTLLNCTRGAYNTNITTHSSLSTVYFIPITTIIASKINQSSTMLEKDMIISIVDASIFPTSGTILIDSEIMTYTSKNALGDLIRGVNSTNSKGYINNTPLSLLNITLTVKDNSVLVDTTLNNMTINLPDAINVKGRIYNVKKLVLDNTVTINPYGSQTIDNNLNYNFNTAQAFISFQSDGENWKIIGNTNFDPYGAADTALASANNYTDISINNLKDGVLTYLDTLNKIAQAIDNDANFYITVANLLNEKLNITDAVDTYAPLTNPKITGNISRDIQTFLQTISPISDVDTDTPVFIINTFASGIDDNSIIKFKVNNSLVSSNDLIFSQIITNSDQVPMVSIRDISNGYFNVVIRNVTGSLIPSTSQKIAFQIVKKKI